MYIKLLRNILVIFDIFAPPIILGFGLYTTNSAIITLGTIWYCLNLILTVLGLLHMYLSFVVIRQHIDVLKSMTKLTFEDLKNIEVPKDIQPILYSRIFYNFIGIVNVAVLVYAKLYIILAVYIFGMVWFVHLIAQFNRAAVVCNKEFARCKSVKAMGDIV
jgi:hypothetical protein